MLSLEMPYKNSEHAEEIDGQKGRHQRIISHCGSLALKRRRTGAALAPGP